MAGISVLKLYGQFVYDFELDIIWILISHAPKHFIVVAIRKTVGQYTLCLDARFPTIEQQYIYKSKYAQAHYRHFDQTQNERKKIGEHQ
jgi:hypothetical protein